MHLLSVLKHGQFLNLILNNKKMPCVPPTCHENKFIPDFKHKDELFNSIFTNCSLISKKCKTDYYFA